MHKNRTYATRPLLVVLVLWGTMMAFGHNTTLAESELLLQEQSTLFLSNTKAGDQTLSLRQLPLEAEGDKPARTGYELTSEAHLEIFAMGSLIPLDLEIHCKTEPDFALRTVAFHMNTAGTEIAISAQVRDGTLETEMTSVGTKSQESRPIEGPIYSPDAIYQIIAQKGYQVGKEFTLPVYDPMSSTLDDIKVKIDKMETLQFGGEPVETYLLKMDFRGFEQSAWVDDNGISYQELSKIAGQEFLALRTLPDGTTVDRPARTDSSPKAVDLLQASFIVPNCQLPKSQSITRMVVALKGITEDDVVWDAPLQTRYEPTEEEVRQHPDAVFVCVEIVPFKRPKALAQAQSEGDEQTWEEAYQSFLSPSMLVQSDNEIIIKKSREITQEADNDWQKVERISDWVYRNLRQEFRVTIPSALEVLHSLSGDCNEHSTLFAALCRAEGIPTKICSGIVYLEGSFGYHAWNEVLLPGPDDSGVWIPIDTTLGQKTVDATHVKLAEGGLDQQTALAKVIGKLKLEILHYEYAQ